MKTTAVIERTFTHEFQKGRSKLTRKITAKVRGDELVEFKCFASNSFKHEQTDVSLIRFIMEYTDEVREIWEAVKKESIEGR